MKRLGQQDLLRHVVGIEWAEPAQFLNHFRSDSLRLVIFRSAIHHAMPNCGQSITPMMLLNPIHQSAHCYRVIRRRQHARKVVRLIHTLHPQGGVRESNALNPALENSAE